MERFKRRPLAAAMLMAFSASAPEWALAQAQSEQTLPEVRVRGGDSFRTETTVSRDAHRDAAARHSAVHQYGAAVA